MRVPGETEYLLSFPEGKEMFSEAGGFGDNRSKEQLVVAVAAGFAAMGIFAEKLGLNGGNVRGATLTSEPKTTYPFLVIVHRAEGFPIFVAIWRAIISPNTGGTALPIWRFLEVLLPEKR